MSLTPNSLGETCFDDESSGIFCYDVKIRSKDSIKRTKSGQLKKMSIPKQKMILERAKNDRNRFKITQSFEFCFQINNKQ